MIAAKYPFLEILYHSLLERVSRKLLENTQYIYCFSFFMSRGIKFALCMLHRFDIGVYYPEGGKKRGGGGGVNRG